MDYRYWDAVTFLGWLAEESDKVVECRPVIEAAEGGSVVLVTSGHGEKKLSAHSAKKIEDFFRHQWIVVREVDRFIAEAARDVVWNKNVKPKDAIHIATALQVGPDVPWVVGTSTIQIALGASMPVGSYTIQVSSVRPTAAPPEAKSAPVTLILTDPPPSAPSLLRLVEITLRGLDSAGLELWRQTLQLPVP